MKWMKSRIASCYCSFVVTIIVTFTILGLQNIASSLLSIEIIPTWNFLFPKARINYLYNLEKEVNESKHANIVIYK